MLEMPDVGFRSHGDTLQFRDDPAHRARVRFHLSRVDFRAASTGEAPVYMHAPEGVRDRTGEVFPLYCYFDDETTEALGRQRALLSGERAVEVEGVLLHWIRGLGLEMIDCRLLSAGDAERP